MQVQIKFKRTGSNSVYGSFAAGDVLRCDAALAAHYVKEGIAWYMEKPVVEVAPAPTVEVAPAQKRGRSAKAK
ncbi:hypothetical protein [Propionivibrio sp.]|uniref:hypothetical protein n=1 Tax=Propionivibrio sp. TaxID=2212460 RepID=UPI003BEFAA45